MKLAQALSLFSVLSTALLADQVVMKNGDKVSGDIVKKDAKTLTIKSKFFGVLTLPWDEVESVRADTPINVVLPGEQTVKGTLAPAGGKIEVGAEGQKRTVAPAEIIALRNAECFRPGSATCGPEQPP